MKIVIAVHHFPPRYTGGAEWQAYRTAAGLLARGHDVRVVCVERNDIGSTAGVDWQDDEYEGVPVRRLFFNMWAAPDPHRWEYDNLWIGEHLEQWLADTRPDVFHLVSGYLLSGRALQVAQSLSIPTVVTLMDFWFLCRRVSMLRSDGRVSRLPINPVTCARCLAEERRRYRWLGQVVSGFMEAYWKRQMQAIEQIRARTTFLLESLNRVSTIISNSRFLRSVFVEVGITPERIVFMRQGLDFAGLSPEVIEKTPSPRLRVGYIGQLAELKGIHVLIEAARRIPDVRLIVRIYGDADRFPRYTARLKKLIGSDSRIRLAGMYQGHDALSQVMRGLDVIVVPSLWYENSPNVILEAFAYRTPVIASDFGGMAELVQHGENGLLFRMGAADDLARQLRRLLDEPGLLARLRAGIQPVKSVAQEMDELETIYQRLVTEASRLRLIAE